MSKTLILCEKPSQAQDFTKGLSENFKKEKGYYESDSYIICYARGHLIRLYEPEEYDETYKEWSFDRLPIIPDEFCYQVSEGDSSQLFNIISGQLNRSDVSKIVVATDAEREGELIARLILDAAGIPQHDDRLYRFWTSGALTPKEITASLEKIKPLNEYNRLYIAAKARQQADWLIGINATRAATIQAGGGVVSIGRVQTPTLNLLVKRHNDISCFTPEKYFELIAICESSGGTYQAKMIDEAGKIATFNSDKEISNLFPEKSHLQAQIISIDKTVKTEKPPMLYSLSSLQKEANAKYGIRASDTLAALQSLYDKKYTTYPRTGSEVLEEQMASLAEETLLLLGMNGYDVSICAVDSKNKRIFNNSLLSDHHAIIPTGTKPYDLSDNEKHIYDMVCQRFIAAFYPDYTYEETVILTDINGNTFRTKGNRSLDLGWKSVYESEYSESGDIPVLLSPKDHVLATIEAQEKETVPPKHYTDGTLIADMENAHKFVSDDNLKKMLKSASGIGTPATQANIIDILIKRGYAVLKGKNIIATPEGKLLIEILTNEQVADPAYTALWEKNLEDIAKGLIESDKAFIDATKEMARQLVSDIKNKDMKGVTKSKEDKKVVGICPECGQNVVELSKSYSCSDKACGFLLWKNKLSFVGKATITAAEASNLLKAYCDSKSVKIKLKSKKGASYEKRIVLSKHPKYNWGIVILND